MRPDELDSFTIANLRGYVDRFTLPFEKGKKLCIVYGENGTGKTTLCDALELLASGTMGSLADRGLGRVEKYWTPIAGPGGPATIELKTRTDVHTASVENGKVSRAGAPEPRVVVLRRPALMDIVTASAAKRYEAIANLVDVAGVEAAEQSLSNLMKEVEREAADQEARLAGAQAMLRKLADLPAGEDPIAWARGEAERDVSALVPRRDALGKLIDECAALVRRWEETVRTSNELTRAREVAAQARTEVDALASSVAGGGSDLLALLKAAGQLLSTHADPGSCPLCESRDAAAGLASRVESRLGTMDELRRAQENSASSSRYVEVLEAQLARLRDGYAAEHRALMHPDMAPPGPAAWPALPADLGELGAWLEATRVQQDAWVQEHRELTSLIDNADRLRGALREHDENVVLATRSARLLEALRRAHETVRGARHRFVNELLAEVSQEVGRLYERVHEGEGLNRINLGIDPKRKASLNLATSFRAVDAVPPQAYLSDSHLDTLGLCVFIALAKRRSPERTILVLDDVLASVDEPHVARLIEMISAEAHGFRHVLVTTHYQPWKEKLRWGALRRGQVQLVELERWSSSGPRLIRSTAEIELFRELLGQTPPDVRGVVGKAGIVLERILNFLTETYACRLPRNPRNVWTIRDLLNAIGKKLKAALRIERADARCPDGYTRHDLGPLLDEIGKVAELRNLFGAHDNELSFHMPQGEALDFARKVLDLADLIVCPENGWPRSDKSGSYWATAGETRRLHPLREPG